VPGAAPDIALKKEEAPIRFVLTGTFPSSKYVLDDSEESELQKGKAAVTGMIESFGGKVSTAISGCVLMFAWHPHSCSLSRAPAYSTHSICIPPSPSPALSPPPPP
jgi:hypothetical protein